MATAPILHVGEDLSYRIPIMEKAGLSVRRAPCSEEGILDAFAGVECFSALTFQLDVNPIPPRVLKLAHNNPAPLVLFENTVTEYDQQEFDLVIPSLTRPEKWLPTLRLVVEHSRRLGANSVSLRQESDAVCGQTRDLHTALQRNLPNLLDLDAIWRQAPEKPATRPFKPRVSPDKET